MRGKKPPQKRGALVGLGLGLQDIYGIKNIIVHSVNNFLLPMINSVNVKNNRYVVCVFAICDLQFIIVIIFYVNTVYY